ncbi:hypothetical protein TWF730_004488 [Orbilia blumenaviensis]|uniref:F-box domain-containing protein n=1 Tax=Orbilia blumenaviensis TaxID=1796055 RepID=A0AAV9U0Q5_9PEZI
MQNTPSNPHPRAHAPIQHSNTPKIRFWLFDLPNELVVKIMAHLNSDDKRCLSMCSKSVYYFVFPFRNIYGFRFTINRNYEDYVLQILERFEDGQRFAGVRRFFSSLTLTSYIPVDLSNTVKLFSKCTSITNITLRISHSRYLERDVYVKTLSSLSALPYYHNIQHVGFDWDDHNEYPSYLPWPNQRYASGSGSGSDSDDVETFIPNSSTIRSLNITADEKMELFAFNHFNEEEELFHNWVSHDTFKKLATKKKIYFPSRLRSFLLDVPKFQELLLLPLKYRKLLTVVSLKYHGLYDSGWDGNGLARETDGLAAAAAFELPTVKALMIHVTLDRKTKLTSVIRPLNLFPNLVSLILQYYDGPYSISLAQTLYMTEDEIERAGIQVANIIPLVPDIPKLKCLAVKRNLGEAWFNKENKAEFEVSIRQRLKAGNFPALRVVRVFHKGYSYGGYASSTCVISRVNHVGEAEEDIRFKWYNSETERIVYDSHPSSRSYLDGYGTSWWSAEDLEEADIDDSELPECSNVDVSAELAGLSEHELEEEEFLNSFLS